MESIAIKGWNVTDEHGTNLLELRRETANDALAARTSHKHKHLPALDGVRGVAVLMVFLVHYGGGAKSSNFLLHIIGVSVQAGWSGVTFFFILSGFLISGILLDTKESPNYFKNFYARRVLRIWPLYYCLLAFMFVVLPHASASQGVAIFAKSSPWWAYPFFLQNFLLPLSTDAAGPLGVTWSLAIEE